MMNPFDFGDLVIHIPETQNIPTNDDSSLFSAD